MTEQNTHIQVEALSLPLGAGDGPLNQAFADYETKNPQYGERWLANLTLHALDDTDRAVIYVARRSADDFIACPLKVDTQRNSASSLSTFYTSAYSPVVCSDSPGDLFQALFQYLAGQEGISALTLSPMNAADPLFAMVRDSLELAGWKGRHDFFCFGNWIHDTGDESYQDYLASRPSKLRNTIARKTKKFLAEGKGQLELVTGGDALEDAIADYVTVYNHSWKHEEPYPNFVPELLRLAANRGWLRLGIAKYEQQAIASQIWLVCGNTAYIFKLAYHEEYRRLSPGTVLTAYMMQRVIDADGIQRIDYLSGDDSYKADWMSRRREQHGIAAYNPRSPRGLAMLAGHTLKRVLKSFIKR